MTATAIMDVVSHEELMRPSERPWTIDDLDEDYGDARRYEIVDGSLHVSPPPFFQHTLIEGRLVARLQAQAPAGVDALTGAGIHKVIDATHWLIPDAVVLRAGTAVRRPDYLAPEDLLLAVEVVSTSSVTHDWMTKRGLYARLGIEHYWIIEQAHELRLTALRLKGPEFEQVAVFGADDVVELEEPFPVRFRLAELVA